MNRDRQLLAGGVLLLVVALGWGGKIAFHWGEADAAASGKTESPSPAGDADGRALGRQSREGPVERKRAELLGMLVNFRAWLATQGEGATAASWPDVGKMRKIVSALADEQGEAGLAWIEEQAPEMRLDYIDEWMKTRPRQMLNYVENSSRVDPCSGHQIQEVLQLCSASDGAELLENCKKVPWQHFSNPRLYSAQYDTGFAENGYHERDDVLWGNSGAARYLAEQGVDLYQLFSGWSQKDLDGALQACMDWPDSDGDGAASRLLEVMGNCDGTEGSAAVEKLPDELRQRMRAEVQRMTDEGREGGMLRNLQEVFRIPPRGGPHSVHH